MVHYIARHGEDRVSKAAIISAVPPLMVKTDSNPGGLPKQVFDDLKLSSRPIAPSFTMTYQRARSMAITDQAPNPRRESSGTGGARA